MSSLGRKEHPLASSGVERPCIQYGETFRDCASEMEREMLRDHASNMERELLRDCASNMEREMLGDCASNIEGGAMCSFTVCLFRGEGL